MLSIGFPFGGIRNERLRDPKTEMLKAGLGRSCAPLSCPHRAAEETQGLESFSCLAEFLSRGKRKLMWIFS